MNRTPARVALAALILAAICAGVAAAASTAVPTNTARPSISGALHDGATLTTSNGRWSNSPTSYAYDWLRCGSGGANCVHIGATGKRYTLTSADIGHTIRSQVVAANASGSTSATSTATRVISANGAKPTNTSAPRISGNAQEGQTLTATSTWSGTQPITYNYQWNRCDSAGNGCAAIAGATGSTYNTTSADVAHTLRVLVTATNSHGTANATSNPTAIIAPAKSGGAAIAVSSVALPDRLVVDNVKFSPQPLGHRGPLTGRFHVADSRGFSVSGALVYALGLPYGWVRNSPEVASDGSGWATITFSPTARMPLTSGTQLVVFVRARKPGDNLLAGVSTRRLVQARIR